MNYKENHKKRRRTTMSNSRNSFLELLERIENIEQSENVNLKTAQDLGEIIKEATTKLEECSLTADMSAARDIFLDSPIISTASGLLYKCVKAVDMNTANYDPGDFAGNILSILDPSGNDEECLLKLYDTACSLIPRQPSYYSLFGTFDPQLAPEPKAKKSRRREVQEQLQRKQPKQLVYKENEDDNVNNTVRFLHEVLIKEHVKNKKRPIGYYEYVIDTSSFEATVENMFYCAFLVRDGKARMDVDKNGNPLIEPVDENILKTYRAEGGTNRQMIAGITYHNWKEFKFKSGFLQKHKLNAK